jgi:hypothetical protein
LQICPAEFGLAEVRHDETRSAEVWYERGFFSSPSIPHGDPLQEPFEVVCIGHLSERT